jgi:hypothetical protein
MNQTRPELIECGSTQVAHTRSDRITVSAVKFGRLRIVHLEDGTETYDAEVDVACVLRRAGSRAKLWLKPEEIENAVEALRAMQRKLDESESLSGQTQGSERQAEEVTSSPSAEDRYWVNHRIEWMVSRGVLPDRFEFEEDPVTALVAAGVAAPWDEVRRQLLFEEVRRAFKRQSLLSDLGDWEGPVDPYGSLEGPRTGESLWLGRGPRRGDGGPPCSWGLGELRAVSAAET